MGVTFSWLSRCYRTLLWLYPAELRRAYGRDMADCFERALDLEWKRRGRWGVARAGLHAASEVFTVAIPRHLTNEWLITGGLSLVINCGILALLVGIMTSPPGYFHR
jgi:hypothetical protein